MRGEKTATILRFVEEYGDSPQSRAEVAEKLGVSTGFVRSTLSRSRRSTGRLDKALRACEVASDERDRPPSLDTLVRALTDSVAKFAAERTEGRLREISVFVKAARERVRAGDLKAHAIAERARRPATEPARDRDGEADRA